MSVQCTGIIFSKTYPDMKEKRKGGEEKTGREGREGSGEGGRTGRNPSCSGDIACVIQAPLVTDELTWFGGAEFPGGKLVLVPHTFLAIMLGSQSCGSRVPSPAAGYLLMFLFAIKSILFIMSWSPNF